jgi:hypothetical protein
MLKRARDRIRVSEGFKTGSEKERAHKIKEQEQKEQRRKEQQERLSKLRRRGVV